MTQKRRQLTRVYIFFSVLLLFSTILNRQFTVTGLDYLLYAAFMGIFCIYAFRRKKLVLPKRYATLILLFLGIIVLNSVISQYTPSWALMILATFITFLPFLHFAISYNVDFTDDDIRYFIDTIIRSVAVIAAIMYVETFLLGTDASITGGLIGSNLFMIGFVASLCNQALLLSLCQYIKYRRRKYLYFGVFFLFTIVLTIQFKALLGAMLILTVFYLSWTPNKRKALITVSLAGIIALGGLFSIPTLRNKLYNYAELYDLSNPANDGIARIALYLTAFQIAEDHFPLGTGQGTFGSIPIKFVYSDVYYDYGINRVWGLEEVPKYDFRLDTHWSSILGETGVLGLTFYIMLMTFPFWRYRKVGKKDERDRAYYIVLILSPLCMMFESVTLPLPNRLAFIVIYSGLTAVILRHHIQSHQSATAIASYIPNETDTDSDPRRSDTGTTGV